MRLKLVREQNQSLSRKAFGLCTFCPDWKTKIGEDVTSRLLDRVQGATKTNTSETLVLQRYFEIVPSVNRTAVRKNGNTNTTFVKAGPASRSMAGKTRNEK